MMWHAQLVILDLVVFNVMQGGKWISEKRIFKTWSFLAIKVQWQSRFASPVEDSTISVFSTNIVPPQLSFGPNKMSCIIVIFQIKYLFTVIKINSSRKIVKMVCVIGFH